MRGFGDGMDGVVGWFMIRFLFCMDLMAWRMELGFWYCGG
jgi:hypothetical protein